MRQPIDLSKLPPPEVIEPLNFETLLAQRKAHLVELVPEDQRADVAAALELESEPLTKFLEESVYRELLLRQRINEAARAVLLASATGGDLDQLAALFGVERRLIDPGDEDAIPPLPPTYEDDTELRRRVQLSLTGMSVAGPVGAYVYHALSAHPQVLDASVESPDPGSVVVTVLGREEPGVPDAEVVAAVEAAVNADDVRPLTDLVTVQAATIVDFAIDATLHYFPGPSREVVRELAESRLQTFLAESRRLGRDIPRSALHAALHVEGVQRVDLTSPATDVIVALSEAAHASSVVLTDGDDDG